MNASNDATSTNTNTTVKDTEPPPPLLIKLTGYRILNVVLIMAFVAVKAVLAYQGRPSATTVDWVSGGVVVIVLWWLGLYESLDPPIWPWFFHNDYAYPISQVLLLVMRGFVHVGYHHPRTVDYLVDLAVQLVGICGVSAYKVGLPAFLRKIPGGVKGVVALSVVVYLLLDLLFWTIARLLGGDKEVQRQRKSLIRFVYAIILFGLSVAYVITFRHRVARG